MPRRERAGLKPSDVALWEINEAFASVPIAASGARMMTKLVYELQRRGGGIGVAAMCAGGGQGGGAVVVEV